MLMLPEVAQFSLILALLLACIQAILPLLGTYYHQIIWMQTACLTAVAQFLFITCSFLLLMVAFIQNDFSVVYVAANSNSLLPLIYRCCAVWGAHEGSLLLWVFILSLWTLAVSIFPRDLPITLRARVLAVLGMISAGFLIFLLFTSNPFLRLLPNIPMNGQDLNPLLQDPGLVIHPPLLYLGYVGFAVPFAFALAALMEGQLTAMWARWVRPWALIAWCFLTGGIILGSWWAYRELGWGGWWFWDPVENASLLPWFVATAFVHSLIAVAKREAFKTWAVLLAIMTFSLSLLGTFLVRSGILISVHAFATDPRRGNFLLLFLALVVSAALTLFALRAHKLRTEPQFALLSRETLLLLNNLFFTVIMLTVLLGTIYPLILDALNLGKISVGPPYFNLVFIPLMLPLLFLMGLAPHVLWWQNSWLAIVKKMWWIFIAAILISLILIGWVTGKIAWLPTLGLSAAFWIILATLTPLWIVQDRKLRFKKLTGRQWGMTLAHIGIAITVIGVTLNTHYHIERDVRMNVGDTVQVQPYQFQLLGLRNITGPNYSGVAANILVSENQQALTFLQPEQRVFTVQQIALTKAAIDVGLWRDLYVALGEPIGQNSWALRVYYQPFVRWIWSGGLLVLLGGLVAVFSRRKSDQNEFENNNMKNEL